jgi:hypothetical protein
VLILALAMKEYANAFSFNSYTYGACHIMRLRNVYTINISEVDKTKTVKEGAIIALWVRERQVHTDR